VALVTGASSGMGLATASAFAESESIRAFAGERWEEAVITPKEEHLLKETWIGHYEVIPTPS
jgi:NAD(P)-dependent dehydrogenase (short-subunit alcohol dehydrogenase family)